MIKYDKEHSKEYHKEYDKEYYSKNRETLLTFQKKYYLAHKKERLEYAKKYRLEHENKSNAHYHKRRDQVFNILGRKCKKCGFDDIRALQVDHIDGGGCKEIRESGHVYMYNKIINSPKEAHKYYQVLCANCNSIKRVVNKERTKIHP